MDNNILKKRLNTFKSSKGNLRQVSDEVVIDVLRAWEQWPGTSADLYRELGLSKMQLVTMLQKAKRLVKSGVVVESDFKEVQVEELQQQTPPMSRCGIELVWKDNVIRFGSSDLLIDFLKKAA